MTSDWCPYCRKNSAGEHAPLCPLHPDSMLAGIESNVVGGGGGFFDLVGKDIDDVEEYMTLMAAYSTTLDALELEAVQTDLGKQKLLIVAKYLRKKLINKINDLVKKAKDER